MEKRIGLLAALLLAFGMTACQGQSAQGSETETESAVQMQEDSGAVSSEAAQKNGEEHSLEDMSGTVLVEKSETEAMDEMEERTMKITVGNTVFTASLADNSSAEALKELLAEGPLTIDMFDMERTDRAGRKRGSSR